jgi:hypothetical protein
MEITLSEEFIVECNGCGAPLSATVGLTALDKRLLSIDPCDKCLNDAEANGRLEGQEMAEARS